MSTDKGVTFDRADFPNLTDDDFIRSSDPEPFYNCIAFAAGNEDEWWDPQGVWPAQVPRDYSLHALLLMYESYGFVQCNDGTLEDGFEKIAIYSADNLSYEHATRQLPNGMWTSKIGRREDIQHRNTECLECPSDFNGDGYGHVVRYMKRPRE